MTGVTDLAHLAVHGLGRADDAPAKGLADALVAEADAENGERPGGASDQVEADAGAVGITGARRNYDALGVEGHGLGHA